MVFQSPEATLNPRHRVGAILSRAIDKLGGSRTVEELAAEVRLDPALLGRRAANLSGGQKQRVAIARAIAGDPALVVCDEPVSALDVSVQAGILTLLADLQRRRGTALLFISHDLAVVEYIADRVAVMHGGRIVDEGDPADVLRDPSHRYTRELVEARSALAEVDQRLGDRPVEAVEDGFQIAAPAGPRRRQRLAGRLSRRRRPVGGRRSRPGGGRTRRARRRPRRSSRASPAHRGRRWSGGGP